MDPQPANEQLVQDFCATFARRDIEEIVAFFAPDAVYHNIPMAPAEGLEAIRNVLAMFVPTSSKIDFEMRHIASAGPVVFTERVDRFTIGGRDVALPVAGVFEVHDGKITAWRDYFDMAMFTGG